MFRTNLVIHHQEHSIIYCITQFGTIVQATGKIVPNCVIQYTWQCCWWWTRNSFETCIARKNGGIKKIIYKNCASRWSFTHWNMMHGSYNVKTLLKILVFSVTISKGAHLKVTYTAWFKKMDSNSYVYISWTIHGMWMIYITFERGGPKFSNTTARALA